MRLGGLLLGCLVIEAHLLHVLQALPRTELREERRWCVEGPEARLMRRLYWIQEGQLFNIQEWLEHAVPALPAPPGPQGLVP